MSNIETKVHQQTMEKQHKELRYQLNHIGNHTLSINHYWTIIIISKFNGLPNNPSKDGLLKDNDKKESICRLQTKLVKKNENHLRKSRKLLEKKDNKMLVASFFSLTHYHTMPHFDALKIYSCGKHCEKRRNCL